MRLATAHPFVAWGDGALLFLTFVVGGLILTIGVDAGLRRFVTSETRARVGSAAAIVATLLVAVYAVLVAFVIVDQVNQVRAANGHVADQGAELTAIYANSQAFPGPTGRDIRSAVTTYARQVVNGMFPQLARSQQPDRASGRTLQEAVASLGVIQPTGGAQTEVYQQTIQLLDRVIETRARIIDDAAPAAPGPLVAVLAFAAIAILIACALLDIDHRLWHVVLMSTVTTLVALTLACVVSLNYPYDGILRISDAPVHDVLTLVQIGGVSPH